MTEVNEQEQLLQEFVVARSITENFQRINCIIPDEWDLEAVRIDLNASVAEALDVMQRSGSNQLAVMIENEVMGYFSYRLFTTKLPKLPIEHMDFRQMPVEAFVENPEFLHINDEISKLLALFDKYEVVFVGVPERLQGILTPMDIARFLHQISYPFILLRDIELALRNLIRACVDEEQLRDCIQASFDEEKKRKPYPTDLEEMTYGDYLTLLGYEGNWQYFEKAFGGSGGWSRSSTLVHLDEIRKLRNKIFHFKDLLRNEEYEELVTHREWILRKARALEARKVIR